MAYSDIKISVTFRLQLTNLMTTVSKKLQLQNKDMNGESVLLQLYLEVTLFLQYQPVILQYLE